MKTYIKLLFRNNGIARGWMYLIAAAGGVIVADLGVLGAWLWSNWDFVSENIGNWVLWLVTLVYVAKTVISAGIQGIVAIRAYLDQHLSKPPKEPHEPTK